MNSPQDANYSIIVIPPGSKRTWRLNMSQSMIFCSISLLCVLFFVVIFLAYNTFRYQNNYREYTILKKQISTQHEQMQAFQENIDHLTLDIERILAQEYDISLLLGDIRYKRSLSKKKTKR